MKPTLLAAVLTASVMGAAGLPETANGQTAPAAPNTQTPPAPVPAKTKGPNKEATTYTDLYVGLEFTHPATWKLKKKNRDVTEYTLPVDGSPDTADLEIRRATYHSTKETWQTIQEKANETMHRQVVRQWEQSVINVPMICTQITYIDKGVNVTTLSGLYYTKTPQKMLVRITTPSADFDKVKYEFDQSLQSLRTTNGTTPEEDDPTYNFPDVKKPQLAPPPPDVISVDTPPPPKLLRGLTPVPLVVSTKPVKLRVPHDWTVVGVKDNVVTLKNARLAGDVTVTMHYSLDSERPALALIHATASELDEFSAGVKREDTDPTLNVEGCSISTVWRFGKTAKGDLVTFHASGEQSDFYFIVSFRSTSAKDLKEDRRAIDELLADISIGSSNP